MPSPTAVSDSTNLSHLTTAILLEIRVGHIFARWTIAAGIIPAGIVPASTQHTCNRIPRTHTQLVRTALRRAHSGKLACIDYGKTPSRAKFLSHRPSKLPYYIPQLQLSCKCTLITVYMSHPLP